MKIGDVIFYDGLLCKIQSETKTQYYLSAGLFSKFWVDKDDPLLGVGGIDI